MNRPQSHQILVRRFEEPSENSADRKVGDHYRASKPKGSLWHGLPTVSLPRPKVSYFESHPGAPGISQQRDEPRQPRPMHSDAEGVTDISPAVEDPWNQERPRRGVHKVGRKPPES